MGKVLLGILLLFFDIRLGSLSITPSFVGYILIYLGLKEYEDEIYAFEDARLLLIIGGILAGITWIPIWGGLLGLLLAFIGSILHLVTAYFIVLCVEELDEGAEYGDLHAARLRNIWYLLVAGTVLALVLTWLPALALIGGLIGAAAAIAYAAAFYQSTRYLA